MTTLPQQETIVQYVANGIATIFVVPFYTPLSTINGSPAIDVYVTLNGQTPVPADDIKVWNVDFTYTPNSDPTTGGNITFLTGKVPPLGSTVTFSRDVPAELTADFSEAQNFSGENLDNVLLQLLMITQQNKTYALNRNLSYIVNSFLPDAIIQANTQIPVLENNQIWIGSGTGVIAATLEQNPDVSTLRSQLANNSPGTDGARLVGYYDVLNLSSTTVKDQLDLLTSNVRLFGTDSGSVNALVLTLANNTATYMAGMEIRIIPANTNTGPATINVNGHGAINIARDNTFAAQPGDIISGKLLILIFDGTKFLIGNLNSIPSGAGIPYRGTSVQVGFLLEDGSIVSQTTYPSLYAAIGSTWNTGGEGSGNFRLPDSRRRGDMGSGGTGSSEIGNITGNTSQHETATLLAANLPPITISSPSGGSAGLGAGLCQAGSPDRTYATFTVNSGSGISSPVNIVQPSMIVTKMIKI